SRLRHGKNNRTRHVRRTGQRRRPLCSSCRTTIYLSHADPVPGLGQLNFAFYRRARRLVFRAAVFFLAGFLFATFFLRRGARPTARFAAGVARLTLARPACRAPLVDSSITSAAAFAAAPASLAISTPRCAASVIALFAFVVTLLTILMPLVG